MSARLHTSTEVSAAGIRFANAWTAADGSIVHAAIYIGRANLILDSPGEADALIAAATEAKAELIRLEAERKQRPVPAEGGETGG